MVYVTIKEESDERLCLVRQPTLNSWAILVGCSSVGLGIAYYGNDPLWLKAVYVVLGCLIGVSCMDDWEECDFNKQEGEVRLKRVSAWDCIFLRKEDVVVAQLEQIVEAKVQEEKVNLFGNTYQVVIKFNTGFSIGITESFSFGSSREHEQIAGKIRTFLDLGEVPDVNDYVDSTSSDNDEENDEDTADDFEHIERSDIISEIESANIADPSEEQCKTTKEIEPPTADN